MPLAELLEIDRWALARTAQLQREIVGSFDAARGVFVGGHYGVYEFHPVVAKLQIFCSEDLGAFYLDILKDRLYTTAPGSHGRRSAQTALWHITHAMLRWMAPFLSFTAEEAWKVFAPGRAASIFCETYSATDAWPGAELLDKWAAHPRHPRRRQQGDRGAAQRRRASARRCRHVSRSAPSPPISRCSPASATT